MDGPLPEICEKYGEVKYHIHNNAGGIEAALLAIRAMDGPDTMFSPKNAVNAVLTGVEVGSSRV